MGVGRSAVFSSRFFSSDAPAGLSEAEVLAMLQDAHCTEEEAAGWAKEMAGWPDHSVQVFVQKLASLNGSRPSEESVQPVADEGEEGGVYINPETGEVGGPRGPEPTLHGDWSFKGRCTDF